MVSIPAQPLLATRSSFLGRLLISLIVAAGVVLVLFATLEALILKSAVRYFAGPIVCFTPTGSAATEPRPTPMVDGPRPLNPCWTMVVKQTPEDAARFLRENPLVAERFFAPQRPAPIALAVPPPTAPTHILNRTTLTAVYRAEPTFPVLNEPALITLRFDVTAKGQVAPRSISVVSSTHRSIEQPAKRAIRKWLYLPPVHEGKAQSTSGVMVTFKTEPRAL